MNPDLEDFLFDDEAHRQDALSHEVDTSESEDESEEMHAVIDELSYKKELQIKVHVIRGANLHGVDLSGSCDPYVEISVLGQKKQTQAFESTIDPVWDEVRSFFGSSVFVLVHEGTF